MGSASLAQNVLNAKSRVLVLTPFSDTSFYDAAVTRCGSKKSVQDGDHNLYKRILFISRLNLGLYVIDLLENCIIIWYYNFLRSEGKCSDR